MARKNACGKGNGPQMQNGPCLWSVLKLLLLNLQTLNVVLKTIPENFIKTYQKVAQGCPFHLFSWLPVAFGHHSAFLVHSFMGYSFCPTLPNTCLSTSVWNSIFSGLNWIFLCAFFFFLERFESRSHAPLYNHICFRKFQQISVVRNYLAYLLGKVAA